MSIRGASVALIRSIAKTYWVRSFVPIEKKSASFASVSASTADAGVSIMTPRDTGSTTPSSEHASSRILRAWVISVREMIIGSIMRTGPADFTLKMARNCVFKRSGYCKDILTPRNPSAGFSSCGRSMNGTGLSPPISSVRITSGRPPSPSAIAWYSSRCSSSLGGVWRPRNRNSLRSRPQPSAPSLTASPASALEPRLAKISILSPSAVRQGSDEDARATAWLRRRLTIAFSIASTLSGLGATWATPRSASRISSVPLGMVNTCGPAATSAGTPLSAASMETCAVGPPLAVHRPPIPAAARRMNCDGNNSSATTISPAANSWSVSHLPKRALSTCTSRSRMSAARSAMRASPKPIKVSSCPREASRQAKAALLPSAINLLAASVRAGSSSSARCAFKISSCCSPPADAACSRVRRTSPIAFANSARS